MKDIIMNNKQASKFATHPIFDIDGLDWLCQYLTATPAKFGDFSAPPKSDSHYSAWQERCACIGMMTPPCRALCSILIWGMEKRAYDVICSYMADKALAELNKITLPKNCPYDRATLSYKMAHMVLSLHLNNAWDLCTVKGRLYFFSIDINEKTYAKQFTGVQRLLIETLDNVGFDIGAAIHNYKKTLKCENSA